MILLIILFTLSSTDYETLAGKSQTSTAEPKSKQNWKPAVSLVASGLSDAVQQCCYSCQFFIATVSCSVRCLLDMYLYLSMYGYSLSFTSLTFYCEFIGHLLIPMCT